jgi:hypothetical protein
LDIVLNAEEIAELDKQDPAKEKNGGFQRLMVWFQRRVDRVTGRLTLTVQDMQRIRMYAFKYGDGSWERWLLAAFSRTLGPRPDGSGISK